MKGALRAGGCGLGTCARAPQGKGQILREQGLRPS